MGEKISEKMPAQGLTSRHAGHAALVENMLQILGKGEGSLEKWRCKKKSAACQQRGFQQFMNLTDLGVCENGVFTTENGKCLGKTMNNHQINHRSMAQPNP
jgi:hypothetical protein